LNIVCGAPNVAAGQKVVVATEGATLYPSEGEPFTIKKGKIRGEASEGMLCAEDEIGLGKSHDGIMVLAADAPVGTTYAQYIGITTDTVLDINLTPNRSDATGHLGVAFDVAAAVQIQNKQANQFRKPDVSAFAKLANSNALPMHVTVADAKSCPRYTGICIKGVRVEASPTWLQNRLKAIGLAPINNIVDITNFVLHELGQPLHAFDYDAIGGQKIVVQTLPQGTKFTTLDGTERTLHADDLMICNGAGDGLCIAGVFGGQHSGVKESTTNIFLESAHFNPTQVRRTSMRHNLRTDAATRFEKTTDANQTLYALQRAVVLILTSGRRSGKLCY
jgi:phenylalanyl-tRNA synthetase beta chain